MVTSPQVRIYRAGAASLKKTLAASVTGGRFGKETGVTVVQALSDINLELRRECTVRVDRQGSGPVTRRAARLD